MSMRLLHLFAQRDGRRSVTAIALGAASIAVATALILLVLSFSHGIGERGTRTAWQRPAEVPAETATAQQLFAVDVYKARTIARVDLAPVGDPVRSPVPPGLPRFPAPGELWVSPALGELMDANPPGELADRFAGSRAGVIEADGLAHRDDLVVVVGRAAGDLGELRSTAPLGPSATERLDVVPGTPISAFTTDVVSADYEAYQLLATFAALLLAVPGLLLIGSGARLTATRRGKRFARLRLAGAKPSTVVMLGAIEAGIVGLVGAAIGIVAAIALLPSIAAIPINGGAWRVGDLWFGLPLMIGTLVVVPFIAVLSVVVGLREVVSRPIDVAQQVSPRLPGSNRLLVAALSWIVLLLAILFTRQTGGGIPFLMFAAATVIGSVAVVGPLLVRVLGHGLDRFGNRASTMLAARRILDDTKGTFRTVMGVVLAGLIAGFIFATVPTIERSNVNDGMPGQGNVLSAYILGARPSDVESTTRRALAPNNPNATVETNEEYQGVLVRVTVPDESGVERARTALLREMPTKTWSTSADVRAFSKPRLDDVKLWSLIVLGIAMAFAFCTIAIAMVSSVHEQRSMLVRQHLAGTSLETMGRVRAWQAGLPVVVSTAAAVLLGLACGCGLLAAFGGGSSPGFVSPNLVPLIVLVIGTAGIGPLAAKLTKPVLRRAIVEPVRE